MEKRQVETVTNSHPLMLALNFFFNIIGAALIVFLLCSPTAALAQDVLLGTVVSVDREKGFFVLQLNDSQESNPELVTIHTGESPEEKIFLPECVEVGESVRVWGEYGLEGDGAFQAAVVRGPGLGQFDKSGVRSRLKSQLSRGQGKQFGRQSGRSRNRQKR